MSNWNENAGELAPLFGLCRDAILGVRGVRVVFANPAAAALFGEDCVGQRGDSLLPDYVFSQAGDSYLCTATVRGEDVTVSAVRQGELLLLSIPRQEREAAPISNAVLTELRTTAYNLRMASELIIARSGRDEKLSAYASILFHNYYTMTRLTRNLADMNALSKGELSFQPALLDLVKLCEDLLASARTFLRDRGTALVWKCSLSSLCIRGDRERIEQLILNLLSNSLLHTSTGDVVTLSLQRQGGRAILAVSDNGSGISAARLNTLFTRQDTSLSDASGAGLGLCVCQGIARVHGGAMILESREGRGTEVRVMLPVSEGLPLHDAQAGHRGPGLILTELSPVLGHEAYSGQYMD